MPGMPEKQFPGAWPESPVMDICAQGNSLEDFHRPSSPSFSGGSARHPAKKPSPLRIVVPPSEYCPFSTDLTLPSTPLSLPTPVSSSCFTFADMPEPVHHSVPVPPTLTPVASTCPQVPVVADLASPTSSQFLLMPPTPHLENVDNEPAIYVSPHAASDATDEPGRSESLETKSVNLRPWKVSSSTWLSDLGGHTETDRIFRHNLLGIALVDTESSPASTPALTPSALSPSSQVPSSLAHNSPSPVARLPAPLPSVPSQHPCAMSSQSPVPARLILKPTGTVTFPSILDSLQTWREGVMPGLPRSEEPHSPVSDDIHAPQLRALTPETRSYPSLPPRQPHSHPFPRVFRVSRSRTLIQHAKMFGGRVRQLVTRQSVNKHRGTMDRGVNFRVVTSQDSENGSVILISAPPPPYDSRPPTRISHGATGREHVRSRTVSEYSSAVQTSTTEPATAGAAELGSRQEDSSRNALRRLSFAALSTIRRF